ncbi:uncharacterized protein LOC110254289 [Exaiptasia diaphana]|uniref:Uncharacterized protein n=1 Tax=Exaiptasia diaphana TaxID=2652724 RepID=A0A913YAY0_EXADI|nr:uncharacterized protein LOC110254289 [Exaiptasia diaphana]KXJ21322.1 hypothetical protein AC249_AIPGENE22388 [Exaiptasia diaphana]
MANKELEMDTQTSPRNNFFVTSQRRESKIPIDLFKSKVRRLSDVSSSSYILNSLDISTAFIGNIFRTNYRRLAAFGLVLWIVNIVLCFSFDFYEAHKKYGIAWGIVKAVEWLVFCCGSYFVIFKTIPWMKEGLRKLENNYHGIDYEKSMFKITLSLKKLQLFLVIFTITGATFQYLTIKFADKSGHVTFNQSLSSGAVVVLNICRFMSSLHMLYAYALFWCLVNSVMVMAGHSMVQFQECISTKLRNKRLSPTFREAVSMFDERLHFVKSSSRSCVVLLFLLLFLTLLSVMVNIYLFLYKNRFILYIWYTLMPLGLAIYPMCTAAWVTKQYHWYFVAVVKAWAEYPEDSSSESEEETAELNDSTLQVTRSKSLSPEPDMGIHLPNSDHVSVDEPITEGYNERWRNVLRGSIRVVGRLQHQRKITKFNFEKYISYLQHVTPGSGFKIGALLVTWEKVSTSLFLLTSIVAVFLQETIFGNQKPNV